MFDFLQLLVVSALVLGASARLVHRYMERSMGSAGTICLLASGVLIQIVPLVLILGYTGFLGEAAISLSQTGVSLALLLSGKGTIISRLRTAAEKTADMLTHALLPAARLLRNKDWQNFPGSQLLTLALILLLACFALIAALTPPMNHDSVTYRLPRSALWLQDGGITHYGAGDVRIDYIPYTAELLTIWLISFFSNGFPLVKLISWCGGLLLLAGTSLFLRILGWSRIWRRLGALLIIAMPNATHQFITTQTDGIAAGTIAAALALTVYAFQVARWPLLLPAAVLAGVSLGVKGLSLYLLPALLPLFTYLLWKQRRQLTAAQPQLAASAAVLILLAAPPYLHNWQDYGHPLAPAQELQRVNQSTFITSHQDAATTALAAYAAQTLEPFSNPPWLRPLTTPLFQSARQALEEKAAHRPPTHAFAATFADRINLVAFIPAGLEDYSSFGLVPTALMLLGLLTTVGILVARRGRGLSGLMICAALGLLIFFLFFAWSQEWTAHKGRYFTVIMPLMVPVALLPLRQLPERIRSIAVVLVALYCLSMAAAVPMESGNNGVRQLLGQPPMHADWQMEGRAAVDLLSPASRRIGFSLPPYRLAHLMRSSSGRTFVPVPPSEAATADSLAHLLADYHLDGLIIDSSYLPAQSGEAHAQAPWPASSVIVAEPGGQTIGALHSFNGIYRDMWTAAAFSFRVYGHKADSFDIIVANPTPQTRQLFVSGDADAVYQLKPHSTNRIAVPVIRSRFHLDARVTPAWQPEGEPRHLGIKVWLPELSPVGLVRRLGPEGAALLTISLEDTLVVPRPLAPDWSVERNRRGGFLWLGTGRAEGLHIVLRADSRQDATFTATLTPGPDAPPDGLSLRLHLMHNAHGISKVRFIDAATTVRWHVTLQPGCNDLLLFVEPSGVLDEEPLPSGGQASRQDSRSLMLRLEDLALTARRGL